MSRFTMHDLDSAPDASKKMLEGAKKQMGFIPNVFGYLAEAPSALEAYFSLDKLLSESSLSEAHKQLILLVVSVENDCRFCVAAHTGGAKGTDLNDQTVEAIRSGKDIENGKDAALAVFVRKVVKERGHVSDQDVADFIDAGFTKANVIEVVLGVSLKTLSNYTNHITGTELNDELKDLEWKP